MTAISSYARKMELSAQCVVTEDFAEAAAAFLAKRSGPVFGGSGLSGA
jgi:hypothetical protein